MRKTMMGLFAVVIGASAACVAEEGDQFDDQSQELHRCRYRRCRDAGSTMDAGTTPTDAGSTLDSGSAIETGTQVDSAVPPPPPEDAGTACRVNGGTSTSPTNLGSIVNASGACNVFVLGDGHYAATTITRAGITMRAANRCGAQLRPELRIDATNVTVDGVSVTAAGVAVSITKSGVRMKNSCIQGFGKTQYGNGIWVLQEALDPNNRIIIEGNALDDWGGAMYSGGIAIGKAADNPATPSAVSVEVRNNRITNGPTAPGIYNAGVQSFHPFIAYKNYVHTVSGTSFQNKTFNSRIACNEAVNIIGDGALYNRTNSHNVWEYNIVHDSDVGIDHFMGDGNVFRGNVIYNVDYLGRVKDQGIGSTNLTFENNTFWKSAGWAGFIWDASTGGVISNVLWRRNVFHTVNGSAINTSSSLGPKWDETENIFFATSRPSGTTGANSGSSLLLDPRLKSPPTDFTVQEATAAGRGAPWPLPCP